MEVGKLDPEFADQKRRKSSLMEIDENRCYEVRWCNELGRYLVASKNLSPGDVIIEEQPLIHGPLPNSLPICLGCYQLVNGTYRCSQCGWPMCNKKCQKADIHKAECEMTSSLIGKIEIDEFGKPNPLYSCVIFIRCIALKFSDPDKWEQILRLETHRDERKNSPSWYNATNIIKMLRNVFNINETMCSNEEMQEISGALDVNAYEIRTTGLNTVALYSMASLMEHRCVPNVHQIYDSNFKISLRAAVDIKEGEHLTITYTDSLWPTHERREHLMESKCFECKCERCTDPTEMGTFISAIRCHTCQNGFALPEDPLDKQCTDWKCNKCGTPIGHTLTVRDTVSSIEAKINELDEMDAPTSVYEDLLNVCLQVLHPNHAHAIDLKHTLIHLWRTPLQEEDAASASISNVADAEAGGEGGGLDWRSTCIGEKALEKKILYCKDILEIANKLTPGYSRLRGIVSFELGSALLQKIRNEIKTKKPEAKEIECLIVDMEANLRDALKILDLEPIERAEGQLAAHIKKQWPSIEEEVIRFKIQLATIN